MRGLLSIQLPALISHSEESPPSRIVSPFLSDVTPSPVLSASPPSPPHKFHAVPPQGPLLRTSAHGFIFSPDAPLWPLRRLPRFPQRQFLLPPQLHMSTISLHNCRSSFLTSVETAGFFLPLLLHITSPPFSICPPKMKGSSFWIRSASHFLFPSPTPLPSSSLEGLSPSPCFSEVFLLSDCPHPPFSDKRIQSSLLHVPRPPFCFFPPPPNKSFKDATNFWFGYPSSSPFPSFYLWLYLSSPEPF